MRIVFLHSLRGIRVIRVRLFNQTVIILSINVGMIRDLLRNLSNLSSRNSHSFGSKRNVVGVLFQRMRKVCLQNSGGGE